MMKINLRYGITISAASAIIAISGLAHISAQTSGTAAQPEYQIVQQRTDESGKVPAAYTITVHEPVLQSSKGKADPFNQAVQKFVDAAKADFMKSVAPDPNMPAGANDYLLITDDVFATDNGFISIRFTGEQFTGGAHPGHFTATLNYSLIDGKELTLASIFKPNSTYLDTISKFAVDELTRENRLSFPDGATPKAENYANWNLVHGGLLFTFDEYQVGPYAQGPSEIFIPYTTLGDLIDDNFLQQLLSRPTSGS